jgi:SAM-dependent methyltransferase
MKPSPIGDAFVKNPSIVQELFPLDVYICLDCGHLQNLDVVDSRILFGNYTYHTSHSLGLVEHFKKYASHVIEKLGISPPGFILEIGSNDGSLLSEFKRMGYEVLGVDASEAVATYANSRGISTIAAFFGSTIGNSILSDHGKASLVCANNVYAHADNMRDITTGIRNILTDDGVFVFEVSYLPDMVENMVFDTIYHEHVSYHTLNPLEKFLNSLDLTLFDIERFPTKGGSIRGYVQVKSTGRRNPSDILKKLMTTEIDQGYDRIEIYHRYATRISAYRRETLEILQRHTGDLKGVAGYGASTTTTTLLYNYELEHVLERIYDDNPIKFGTFSPGAHIEVFSSEHILRHKPKAIVILAWVYAKPIITRNLPYLQSGGVFVLPLPVPRIIDINTAGLKT